VPGWTDGKENKRQTNNKEKELKDAESSECDSSEGRVTDRELAAILRSTNLFDVNEVEMSLKEIETYPAMLPSKFRHTTPGGHGTSRRKPIMNYEGTTGPLYVERLFEVGNLISWAVEKQIHGKTYELYLQSLQYEALQNLLILQDLGPLKELFRPGSSHQGVGECTERLCEEVEEIWRLETGNVKSGQVHIVWAHKILGIKTPPDSCLSINVVIHPYRGVGVPISHMAQHFREVRLSIRS